MCKLIISWLIVNCSARRQIEWRILIRCRASMFCCVVWWCPFEVHKRQTWKLNSTIQLLNSWNSTIQLLKFSTIQLLKFSTIQLFNYSSFQLLNNWIVELNFEVWHYCRGASWKSCSGLLNWARHLSTMEQSPCKHFHGIQPFSGEQLHDCSIFNVKLYEGTKIVVC